MTTTLRPTGPIQHDADGAPSRAYDVCVNSRPVGGHRARHRPARSAADRPDPWTLARSTSADRRRGRGTVAALAAEEVLRGWGCTQVEHRVPAGRRSRRCGSTERPRLHRAQPQHAKELPRSRPLPAAVAGRPMTEAEFAAWRAGASRATYRAGSTAASRPSRGARQVRGRPPRAAARTASPPAGPALRVLVHDGADVGTSGSARRECAHGERRQLRLRRRGRRRTPRPGPRPHPDAARRARVASPPGRACSACNVFAGNTPALRPVRVAGLPHTRHSPVQAAALPVRQESDPERRPSSRSAISSMRSRSPSWLLPPSSRSPSMTYVGVPVTPIALPSAWSASTIRMCRPSISAVSNSSASRPSSRATSSSNGSPRAAELLGALQHRLHVRPALALLGRLLGGLRGGEGVLVLLQREVAQPQLQPVAVALAQGPQVLQGAVAVGALELAPDVEYDGAGGGGVVSWGQSLSPSSDAANRDLGRRRPGDLPELVRAVARITRRDGAGWKGR